jgi:hypothetical protein
MYTHSTAHHTVFIPFIRDYLSLGDLCNLLDHVGVVESGNIHEKRPIGRDVHFYAFLRIRPDLTSKQGRELSKNLQANLTTFIYLNNDRYIEMKPYLSREMRIERGYPVRDSREAALEYDSPIIMSKEDDLEKDDGDDEYDQFVPLDDYDAKDFDQLMRDVDETREELYSLWRPTCYPTFDWRCLS